MTAPLRVMIDARPLSNPRHGGYRSALLSLFEGLRELEVPPRCLCLIDRPLAPEDRARLPADSECVSVPRNRLLADGVGIPAAVRRIRPDVVHGTSNYLPAGLSAPSVVSMFDHLLLHRWPWSKRRSVRQRFLDAWWAASMRRCAADARRIVVPCRGVAEDLARDLALPADRFEVIPPGLRALPTVDVERDARSVLILTGNDPRKQGTALLPHLLDGAEKHDYRLHVAGAMGWNGPSVDPARVRFHKSPSDRDWATQLHGAATLVFPSLREGFGLPPLEAMRAGTAVVAGRVPHLGETLGDVPFPCDVSDPASVLDAVVRSLDSGPERAERIARGRDRVAFLTPRRQADATLAVWRTAA